MRDREQVPYIIVERDSGGVGVFLLGALLGAAAALLFAPGSGEETQREIRQRVTRLRDAAEQRVKGVQQQLGERLEHTREEVRDRVDALRDAVESGKQAASDARADLENRIERTKAAYRAGVEASRAEGEEPAED